ncbi:unnamed protein product [Rhizophagus irregularis]|nr:unnamed protein product [Rhizophagus irregularis]
MINKERKGHNFSNVSNPVGSRTNYKYLKILPHHNIEGKNMESDYKGTRYILLGMIEFFVRFLNSGYYPKYYLPKVESRKLMFKLLSLELYVDQTIA